MQQAELRLVDFHRTTQRYVPEDRTLPSHGCENLKSNKMVLITSDEPIISM
jgi:hypothetical protein